ncbi:hypothetical protein GALL_518910 [mine drainage metagenome]|uniref:Uncharacterized protein n=1 Tax=mine drainage metagenome TaxID=410659 RepID=A0A1J5P4P9_9ZZZZ
MRCRCGYCRIDRSANQRRIYGFAQELAHGTARGDRLAVAQPEPIVFSVTNQRSDTGAVFIGDVYFQTANYCDWNLRKFAPNQFAG